MFSSYMVEIFHQIRCLELRYITVGDLLVWQSALSKNCKYQYRQELINRGSVTLNKYRYCKMGFGLVK